MRILIQSHNWTILFENEQEEANTVNGDRYRAMLNEFLFTKIEEKDIDKIWLQQDCATCHTAEATCDVLRPAFPHRIISRRADVVWSYDSIHDDFLYIFFVVMTNYVLCMYVYNRYVYQHNRKKYENQTHEVLKITVIF